MNASFQSILSQIIWEQGVAILESPAKCNGLLQDYTQGQFKKESRLLLQALEAGAYKELLQSKYRETGKQKLIRKLQDEYGIAKKAAEETLTVLVSVLEDRDYKASDENRHHESEEAPPPAHPSGTKKSYKAFWITLAAFCVTGILFFFLLTGTVTIHVLEEGYVYINNSRRNRKVRPNDVNQFRVLIGAKHIVVQYDLSYAPAEEQFTTIKSGKANDLKYTFQASSKNTIGMPLVYIPPGEFMMGSPDDEPGRNNDEVLHRETIPNGFYIGQFEVTQQEYTEITGTTPSYFKGPDLPVERVSWDNAVAFCNALSVREGLSPAYTTGTPVTWKQDADGYRLPTEVEWEYVCRAGTRTPFYTGASISTEQANFAGNQTMAVGFYPPNSWNVYDMHGNVREWCWDIYTNHYAGILPGGYYIVLAEGSRDSSGNGTESPRRPVNPPVANQTPPQPVRIVRGGAWNNPQSGFLRSASRQNSGPSNALTTIGFRVIRNIGK
jgi:formylglycine-generating enzyme required for sulfatase activity